MKLIFGRKRSRKDRDFGLSYRERFEAEYTSKFNTENGTSMSPCYLVLLRKGNSYDPNLNVLVDAWDEYRAKNSSNATVCEKAWFD